MLEHYILQGHEVVPVGLIEWAVWFEEADRRVALTRVSAARIYDCPWKGRLFDLKWQHGHTVDVSTVFLGLDHSFGGDRPILFETMVFTDEDGGYCRRYCTWEEAEAGHLETVSMFDWHKKEFWREKLDNLQSFWEWRIQVPVEGLIHRFQNWINTPNQ